MPAMASPGRRTARGRGRSVPRGSGRWLACPAGSADRRPRCAASAAGRASASGSCAIASSPRFIGELIADGAARQQRPRRPRPTAREAPGRRWSRHRHSAGSRDQPPTEPMARATRTTAVRTAIVVAPADSLGGRHARCHLARRGSGRARHGHRPRRSRRRPGAAAHRDADRSEGSPGPGDSNGRGQFSWSLDGQRLCYLLSAKKIGPAAAAHIHRGAAGVAGPVRIELQPPSPRHPPPASPSRPAWPRRCAITRGASTSTCTPLRSPTAPSAPSFPR